jgi:tetratricopeptide (TPR) repeat protein
MNLRLLACGLVLVLGLAGCDSPEEQAQSHFESGMELLEKGDNARAYVEFRNALQLVPTHRETLVAYADALESQGNRGQAFGLRRRLAEMSPDQAGPTLDLVERAMELQDWETAENYVPRAEELDPDNPRTQAARLALRYRESHEDLSASREIVQEARALRDSTLPDSIILRQVLLDGMVRDGEYEDALTEVGELIAARPDDIQSYRLRLQLLNQTGRQDDLEAALREMIERFPEDDATEQLLIRYYMSRKDVAKAEEFLRSRVPAEGRAEEERQAVVQFLAATGGPDAAMKELDRLIAEVEDPTRYQSLRAALVAQQGNPQQAIDDLQALLETATAKLADEDLSEDERPEAKTVNEARVLLAQLLAQTGNSVAARREVETVLAADPTQIGALQMKSAWLTAEDKMDEALGLLRRALDTAPDDANTLTLMAQAHLRSGDRQLAGDMLSRAVTGSGHAIPNVLRYVQFLVADGKLLPAEDVLIDALRLTPDRLELLVPLGEIYLRQEDWPRTAQVEQTLRRIGTPPAVEQADRLHLGMLGGQRRNDDALAFLQERASSSDASLGDKVAQLRAQVATGKTDEARAYLDELMSADPDNQTLLFLSAALKVQSGDVEGGIEDYRTLVAANPQNERLRLELIRALSMGNRPEEAREALDAALKDIPEGPDLLWMHAGNLEREGDAEGAIAIYEKLYSRDTGRSILANNLASLLSTAREDEESLDRAWQMSRRLRNAELPAFRDTYGWIAYRRGDYDEALPHLEAAAAALENEPLVTYHLGMTYAALGRTEDARATLTRSVEQAERIGHAAAMDAKAKAEKALSGLETGQ